MTEKKSLKGLCGVRCWAVTENSSAKYEIGEMVGLDGAQSLTKEVTKNDYTIYADDGIYDSGSDYQYTDLKLKVAQLPLEVEALLSGGKFDESNGTYELKTSDMAPEIAFGFAALMISGKYRMWVFHSCKLMGVKADHASKGGKNEVQSYELTLRATQRKKDGAIALIRDSETGDYSWLDGVDGQ